MINKNGTEIKKRGKHPTNTQKRKQHKKKKITQQGGCIKLSLLKKPEKDRWQKITEKTWKPQTGDKIEGILIKQETGIGKYNQNMYIIRENNNDKTIIWGKTQLDKLMKEVKINDYIRITYNGKIKTGSNHEMNLYNLEKKIG